MFLGAVADIHGNFDALARAMARHSDVSFWLCVGDLASRTGSYPAPQTPLYWIKGNNEDFDRIARFESGADAVANLHFLPNAALRRVGPLTVAGLGGIFAAPWYNTAVADLPRTPADDKRRYFVREEVERCKQLRGVDILLTHEAPRPLMLDDARRPTGVRSRRQNLGASAIHDVITALQPRLHLCGHHHRFLEATRAGVRSVCIDRVCRSYLLITPETLEYVKIEQ
jgi:Icc-related predicted phosphoesterase